MELACSEYREVNDIDYGRLKFLIRYWAGPNHDSAQRHFLWSTFCVLHVCFRNKPFLYKPDCTYDIALYILALFICRILAILAYIICCTYDVKSYFILSYLVLSYLILSSTAWSLMAEGPRHQRPWLSPSIVVRSILASISFIFLPVHTSTSSYYLILTPKGLKLPRTWLHNLGKITELHTYCGHGRGLFTSMAWLGLALG